MLPSVAVLFDLPHDKWQRGRFARDGRNGRDCETIRRYKHVGFCAETGRLTSIE